MTTDPGRCHHGSASLYAPLPCTLLSVEEFTPQEKLFRIGLPEGRELNHRPGQFVQVSIPGFEEAPISVANSPTRKGFFELGVRRTGRLTSAMHSLGPGDSIGIRGPFGNPFDLEVMRGQDLLLIAGGCGLAPMRSLIQYCADRPEEFGKIRILYGAKSPQDMLFKQDLESWNQIRGFACHLTVDNVPDASCYSGHQGLITKLIGPLEFDAAKTVAVIVGPPAMYRPVIAELCARGLAEERIAISLERHMRCGVGKCGHCTIDHLYCCTDGPVFWYPQVKNLPGAL